MDLPKIFSFMQRHRKSFKVFDLLCAAAALAYGFYADNWLWVVSGVFILFIAWWDPASRISKHIKSRIVTRPKP